GNHVQPPQPPTDLRAAKIVVELKVGEARTLAFRERGGLCVEWRAVHPIIDFARFGCGHGDPLLLRHKDVAAEHDKCAEEPGGLAGGAIAEPEQEIVVTARAQQVEPALALRGLVARGPLDAEPRRPARDIKGQEERYASGDPAEKRTGQ